MAPSLSDAYTHARSSLSSSSFVCNVERTYDKWNEARWTIRNTWPSQYTGLYFICGQCHTCIEFHIYHFSSPYLFIFFSLSFVQVNAEDFIDCILTDTTHNSGEFIIKAVVIRNYKTERELRKTRKSGTKKTTNEKKDKKKKKKEIVA